MLAEVSVPDAVSNLKRPVLCPWSPGGVIIARWHVSYLAYNLITAHGVVYIHGILWVMRRESDQSILPGLPTWPYISHLTSVFLFTGLPPKNSGFFQQLWKDRPGIALSNLRVQENLIIREGMHIQDFHVF